MKNILWMCRLMKSYKGNWQRTEDWLMLIKMENQHQGMAEMKSIYRIFMICYLALPVKKINN